MNNSDSIDEITEKNDNKEENVNNKVQEEAFIEEKEASIQSSNKVIENNQPEEAGEDSSIRDVKKTSRPAPRFQPPGMRGGRGGMPQRGRGGGPPRVVPPRVVKAPNNE